MFFRNNSSIIEDKINIFVHAMSISTTNDDCNDDMFDYFFSKSTTNFQVTHKFEILDFKYRPSICIGQKLQIFILLAKCFRPSTNNLNVFLVCFYFVSNQNNLSSFMKFITLHRLSAFIVTH